MPDSFYLQNIFCGNSMSKSESNLELLQQERFTNKISGLQYVRKKHLRKKNGNLPLIRSMCTVVVHWTNNDVIVSVNNFPFRSSVFFKAILYKSFEEHNFCPKLNTAQNN